MTRVHAALEVAIAAAAPRGFFATSKFCGPAGYRRSTLSEAIAQRWQVVREALTGEAAQPLCANSIEAALMQGLTAHGALVY